MLSTDPVFLANKLSARMRLIVDGLEDHWPTWDLCCDHGLVGLWAWHSRSIPEIHFVDRAPGVIERLERDVSLHQETRGMHFHPVDAASLALPRRPCNIILCGVGFRAFERILESLYSSPRSDRLVVSLHAEEHRLEGFLVRRGWRLLRQDEIDEAGRLRGVGAWQGDSTFRSRHSAGRDSDSESR